MEVPTLIVQKLANRHGRLLRLKELGAPGVIQENEQRMINEALNELRAFMIEHGAVPSDGEMEEYSERFDSAVKRILPVVKRALPNVTDDMDLREVASVFAEQGVENPMNSEIHDTYRQVRAQADDLDDFPEEDGDSTEDDD